MGTPKQQYVARLLRKPDRVLTAILFWNLVINLTYFTISVITARQLFIEGYHVAAGFLGVFSLFFMILCGEVLPKSIAVIFRRRISELASVPLGLTILPLDRFLPYLQTIDVAFRRSMFPDIKQEPILNADDLERAVDHSPVSKEMAEKEKQVLHNILDLSEITAEVVMRPRGTYFTITAPVSLNDVRGEKPKGGYIFLIDPETNEIESSISLASISQIRDNDHLETAAEKIVTVPWCTKLSGVLALLRRKFRDVAVVVNEYGETIGIVTYEDIIDTILDQQPSRTKRIMHHDPVLEIDKNRYHVDGITTLRYLAQRLNIDNIAVEEEDQTTLAGLLHDHFERFPNVGDEMVWQGYKIRIINATHKGQVRVDIMQCQTDSITDSQETETENI